MSCRSSPREIVLKPCFQDPALSVMNFLNEVVLDYPSAISFAPGRPLESFFDIQQHLSGIADFVGAQAHEQSRPIAHEWGRLGQYDRTNGRINDLIARHLAVDEAICVSPDCIMVTVGAQEAMTVLLAGLFDPAEDVLLVTDPTYIGITGLARVLGIPVIPVRSGCDGLEPADLKEAIIAALAAGKRARAVYDIPDFNNPLGTSLPLGRRSEILAVCHAHKILFLEDNAYGMFAYDARLPTLKALDQRGDVIYIGSFSKTIFPGLRLGYLVADQRLAGSKHSLAQELSKVKSLITVNTPGICQAVAAALLRKHDGSLEPVVAPKRDQVRRNRDVMLECLAREFADFGGSVRWSRPAGGYFLTLTFPFEFGVSELTTCAADFGVIACPMSFFALQEDRRMQVRLSFSYVSEHEIEEGVLRLARFCRAKLGASAAADTFAAPAPALSRTDGLPADALGRTRINSCTRQRGT